MPQFPWSFRLCSATHFRDLSASVAPGSDSTITLCLVFPYLNWTWTSLRLSPGNFSSVNALLPFLPTQQVMDLRNGLKTPLCYIPKEHLSLQRHPPTGLALIPRAAIVSAFWGFMGHEVITGSLANSQLVALHQIVFVILPREGNASFPLRIPNFLSYSWFMKKNKNKITFSVLVRKPSLIFLKFLSPAMFMVFSLSLFPTLHFSFYVSILYCDTAILMRSTPISVPWQRHILSQRRRFFKKMISIEDIFHHFPCPSWFSN